jgi:signal transduction histidine kinase
MADDDAYERHQILAALTGVLLHDLRNPLHSATLLVEALGGGGDANALRSKLRAQFAKLDALISTAAVPIREMTMEPRLARTTVQELFATIADLAKKSSEPAEMHLQFEGDQGTSLVTDRILLARALLELSLHAAVEMQSPGRAQAPAEINLRAHGADERSVRITVTSPTMVVTEAAYRAPFTLASGGLRLALARALSQMAGAALRLERPSGDSAQFIVTAPREDARILG